MTHRIDALHARVILALSLALGACDHGGSPTATALLDDPATGSAVHAPTLASCPTTETHSAQRTVGILGGSITAGGTSIHIPAGAVVTPTAFEVTVPASAHMEVAVTAQGHAHYRFLLPVTIEIDYSRCDSKVADATLSVYHIDELLKTLLERMLGVDDKARRRYTFVTDHLSGYAIAN